MITTILIENSAGGIIGDNLGNVHVLGASEMENLSEEEANFYMPVSAEYLKSVPGEIPQLKEYVALQYGLKVQAGFSKDEALWYVVI